MNRSFFIFTLGMFVALISKAIQTVPSPDFNSVESLAEAGFDAIDVASHFTGQNWLENKVMSSPVDLNQIYQEKVFTRALANKSTTKRYEHSYNTWIEERICPESPYIDKPVRANMTSRFGYRTHPMSGRRHVHAGIDFRGKAGTPVLAGSAGVIKTARRKGAYGRTIVINHGNSFTTLYGHLSGYNVKEGQWVNLGQTIGYIGRSGRATGPHLHFEVRCHNVPLNPSKYLGKMGKVAEVKFKRRRRSFSRQPTFAKRDPNYYTRMINLQKLRKLKQHSKKF